MIPGSALKLTAHESDQLSAWLDRQLETDLEAHQVTEEDVDRWDDLYMARPRVKKKQFPWPGAANVVIPLIGTTVDSIVARIVNTIFSVTPLWSVSPLVPGTQDFADASQDFLDWSQKNEMQAYRSIKSFAIDVVQNGWGWLKPRWETYQDRVWNPASRSWDVVSVNRPRLDYVPVRDVIMQAGIEDENQAEIVTNRIRLTDSQMWDRWYGKRFGEGMSQKDYEALLANKREELGYSYTTSGELSETPYNTIYECWCRMPIPGRVKDRMPVAFVAWYHRPTKTILRAIHNPTIDQRRLLIRGNFVQRNRSTRGLGIAAMLEDLQSELTTTHRQQLDNATLANTRFFIGRRGIGLHQNTRVWPGRFLLVPDPQKDINVMQLGDIYSSMRALEVSILSFAERRSGISDPQLGRESQVLGSRATATGTMAMIQEGNRRFDLNTRDMRDVLSEVGVVMLQLNQQFRPEGFAFLVQGPDVGQFTEQTLNMPDEVARMRVAVELTASTATINKQVEQQGLLALNQVLLNHLQLGQQVGMAVASPQIPAEIKQYVVTFMDVLDKHIKRIARTFEVRDVEAIPSLMENLNAGAQNGAGAPGFGGNEGAPVGIEEQPGMGPVS